MQIIVELIYHRNEDGMEIQNVIIMKVGIQMENEIIGVMEVLRWGQGVCICVRVWMRTVYVWCVRVPACARVRVHVCMAGLRPACGRPPAGRPASVH